MEVKITDKGALDYHSKGRKGKIEVVSSKPCRTQRDLSLAYTPGVAAPCLAIAKENSKIYEYTAKGNLVAVVSNGTAVLGLGDIGAGAGKPVMEGKGILFKRFADIDVFDLEVDTKDPDEIIKLVKLLEPTFGGINLEDIAAPDCFYIEEELKKAMNIPVFHDDQHGTAIISGAALINALELVKKDIKKVRLVVNGAGAAGISCTKHYIKLGINPKNIIMCDSKGVIYKGRTERMNKYKEQFAVDTKLRTLAEAFEGADIFVGVSLANLVTKDMVRSMARDPIIFAMANPDPEISYEDAKNARDDVIVATGRSDYPNQVNNVLGFPFIFRGALDTRATTINEEMKYAATIALANLAKEDVPDSICRVYGAKKLSFSREYLIPKPFDYRALIWVASAVAEAAIKSGVAQIKLDMENYKEELEARLGASWKVMRIVKHLAQEKPKRIVFTEGEDEKILNAAVHIIAEGIGKPILLGDETIINKKIKKLGLNLKNIEILNPAKSPKIEEYSKTYWHIRERKGRTLHECRKLMKLGRVYGPMMVRKGDADVLLGGTTMPYSEMIRPAIRVIGIAGKTNLIASMDMLVFKDRVIFLADTNINFEPNADELADITIMVSRAVKRLGFKPRVAMLSFSNFGSTKHPLSKKVKHATELVKEREPNLIVDGEMRADTALDHGIIEKVYPFSTLTENANVLIFPDLEAANISYNLLVKLGKARAIGPILVGLNKPAHVLSRFSDVDDIVNIAAIAVTDTE